MKKAVLGLLLSTAFFIAPHVFAQTANTMYIAIYNGTTYYRWYNPLIGAGQSAYLCDDTHYQAGTCNLGGAIGLASNYGPGFAEIDTGDEAPGGTWHMVFGSALNGPDYGTFVWGGTVPSDPKNQINTRIIQVNNPAQGTTTASTTIAINFDIENGGDATNYSLSIRNAITGEYLTNPNSDLKNTYGNLNGGYLETVSSTTVLSQGSYIMELQLCKEGQGTDNFGNVITYPCVQTVGNQEIIEFSVLINGLPGVIGFDPTAGQTASSTGCTISLSDFNLGTCFSYLFVPSRSMFGVYTTLPASFAQRFPFSYLASIQTTWNSLSASTTANSPTYSINLHDIGIGSTTSLGNILPNTDIFSASTTKKLFPPGAWDLLMALFKASIWITFFGDVFFTVRNLIRT